MRPALTLPLILARRYLRHPGGKGWLAGVFPVGGVALGVMMLVVVMAVLNGLGRDIKARIAGTEGHIRMWRRDGIEAQVSPAVREVVGPVEGIGRFVQGEVLLVHRRRTAGALLYGVDYESSGRGSRLAHLEGAEAECRDLGGGMALGTLLAQRLGALPGDTVLIATPKELLPKPGGLPPRLVRVPVSCTFSSGLPDIDASVVFVAADQASVLLAGSAPVGLELWLADPAHAPARAARIRAALGDSVWVVRHWGELNRTLFDALRLEKVAMFLVMALVILIAGFALTGGIVRNVIARRVELAMLMTMGCTRRTVGAVFMWEGFMVGFLGSVLGSGAALALVSVLRATGFLQVPGDLMPFRVLPLVVEAQDVVAVVVASLLITTGSALYPAHRASRLDPVAILREL